MNLSNRKNNVTMVLLPNSLNLENCFRFLGLSLNSLYFFLYIYIFILQFEDVQFFSGEVFYRLHRQFPAQITDQARRDVRTQVCREVPEALDAGWHEICRAQPRSTYVRLDIFLHVFYFPPLFSFYLLEYQFS